MHHYRSIHYLRAMAALMVVLLHTHTTVRFMEYNPQSVLWLKGGVDLFFIISGFVMAQITTEKAPSPQDFFKNRVRRIVPLYWYFTLLTLLTTASFDSAWEFTLASLFFIPMEHPVLGIYQPLLNPGWTLNYEMFFYLLFALSLYLPKRFQFHGLCFLLVTLAGIGFWLQPDGIAKFYTRSIILEFVIGMVIARYRLRGHVAMIPLGLIAMWQLHPLNLDILISRGLPAAIIVLGGLSIEEKLPHNALLDLLGRASYSLYLSHLLTLSLLVAWWDHPGQALFIAVAIPCIIIVAIVTCKFIEEPLTRLLTRSRGQREKFTPAALPLGAERL